MNTYLAVAAICFAFSGCARHSADIRLPIWKRSRPVTFLRAVERHEVIINIDSHGKRVIHEERYDSDTAFSLLLSLAFTKWGRGATAVIRADRRAPYDSVIRATLLVREAGFSKVLLATCSPDSALIEDHLHLSYE